MFNVAGGGARKGRSNSFRGAPAREAREAQPGRTPTSACACCGTGTAYAMIEIVLQEAAIIGAEMFAG